MRRLLVALVWLVGCGGDDTAQSVADAQVSSVDAALPADASPPDATPDPLLTELLQLPGVTAEARDTQLPGYRYYVLHVTQPVDHDTPGSPTFQQEVSLLHRDVTAPMVMQITGYDDYVLDARTQPTGILDGNQISIEHRYAGQAFPAGPVDWSFLTFHQADEDFHAIRLLLGAVYPGPWVSTGGSKGGTAVLEYRRSHPDDVVGTVAYVPVFHTSYPVAEYPAYVDGLGDSEPCRQKLRDLQVELFTHRKDGLMVRASDQAALSGVGYERVGLDNAIESAIAVMPFAFWQYTGVAGCGAIPGVSASDGSLWRWLEEVSPVSGSNDRVYELYAGFIYESMSQLGYPVDYTAGTEPYTVYGYTLEFPGSAPPGSSPSYDPAGIQQLIDWLATDGAHIITVYGQWDPYSLTAQPASPTDSMKIVVARGTHEANLNDAPAPERDAAVAMIRGWAGLTPRLLDGELPQVSLRRRGR